MPLLEPSKGRFVPLFAYTPPPEKPISEKAERELAHQRELADAIAAARREGAAAATAEIEAKKKEEIAALRVEMNDTLLRLVTDAVRQIGRQASEDRERLDLAVRSIVEAIAGSDGRPLLCAGLASQLLETVIALRAAGPLTVTLGEEEHDFIRERVPEFEPALRQFEVRMMRRSDARQAAAVVAHETGSVSIDLACVTDRLLEAVKLRASEASYQVAKRKLSDE